MLSAAGKDVGELLIIEGVADADPLAAIIAATGARRSAARRGAVVLIA